MKIGIVALAAGVCLFACNKEEKAGPAQPPPATNTVAPRGAVAVIPAEASNADIACANIVPDVVGKEFAGWKLTEGQMCPTCPKDCKYTGASAADVLQVSADCRQQLEDAALAGARKTLETAGYKDLPGVGRSAMKNVMDPTTVQVTAWDDDSPCQFTLMGVGEKSVSKLEEVAKATLAKVNKDSVKK